MNLEEYKISNDWPLYYEMDDPLIVKDEHGEYWTTGRDKDGVPIKIKNPLLGTILDL